MTMPASPNALNMAGTSSPVSVAYELGLGLTTTISMDQAAVRTLAGVGGSGTTWSMSSLHGKSNITISNALNPTAETTDDGPTTAIINFNSDGTITKVDPAFSYGSANWATPATAGIGSSYWIKMTRTSGVTPSNMTSGTIYSLSTNRFFQITTTYQGQIRQSAGTIDIYSDAGGTTRVGGGTYTMIAEWYF